MKCLYCKHPLNENDLEGDENEACLRCPSCKMRGPLACRTKRLPVGIDLRAEALSLHQVAEERLDTNSASPQKESIAYIAREVLVWGRKANSDPGHTWDPEYANELLDRLRDAIDLRTTVYCLVGREGLEGVFLSPKGAFARFREGGTVQHPAAVFAGCLEIAGTPLAQLGSAEPMPRVPTSVMPTLPAGEEWSCEDCGQANPETTYTCFNCRHLRRTESQTPDNDTYRARDWSTLRELKMALELPFFQMGAGDAAAFKSGRAYVIPLDIAERCLPALRRVLTRTRPDLQFELEKLVAVAREELSVSQEWIDRADRVLAETQRKRSAEFEADLAKLTEAQRRAHARGHLSPEASGGLSGTHYEAHDPVARALDDAPLDDEPVTEQDRLDIAEARSERARGLGITTAELKRRMPQKSKFAATDLPAGWRATKVGYWRSDGMRLHFDGTYWRAAKTDYLEPDLLWSDSMKAMVELNAAFPPNVDARWTIGEDHRYNTSRAFQACTSTVLRLMADHRLEDPLEPRAGMIVAQLAGIHGLRPSNAYGELAAQLSGFRNIANEVLGSKREQNVLLVWVAAKFDDLVMALGG